ncbi:glycosyltransferase [Marinobacter sp. S0848L]|uniref:glycosyltransferase n=1 Tax=Marinobacter sp. S0848L TaxID=2926423 RepID=UPI001FF11840|nr:glycosyltransferase [Marinobacter sp. S0848L]MCK0105470.1 glycosyltransferase [Marinobacter sp. S0848L]
MFNKVFDVDKEICWITWEDHRRSIELAKQLAADYHYVRSKETFVIRHLIKAVKTISIIYRYRKGMVVVQNPSRILAALAALMKLIFRFPLIVDRHTNFRIGKGFTLNPAIWFVILCSEFSLRVADLTIVTNDFLKDLVERKGGRALVLHDKIPCMKQPEKILDLPRGVNILFVCSYAPDEPYREVVSAARLLSSDFHIHITGNYHKASLGDIGQDLPPNIHLLGYVSNEEYDAYMFNCDVVLVLTTSEWVVVCGGYEALAVEKPLITSSTTALREFYQGYACHTEPSAQAIANAILDVGENLQGYQKSICELAGIERERWIEQWSFFCRELKRLAEL